MHALGVLVARTEAASLAYLVLRDGYAVGVMLIAGPETVAPEMVCPLNVRGWHRVSFGFYFDYGFPIEFLARLFGDDTFSMLEMPAVAPEREPDGRLTTPESRQHRSKAGYNVAGLTEDRTDAASPAGTTQV